MLDFKKDISFKELTTFAIGGPASLFVDVKDEAELSEALVYAKQERLQVLVMGGGSNMLVSDNGFNGLVIRLLNKGIDEVGKDQSSVQLSVASGEVWDDVAAYAAAHNYWGIENLSHIPGRMGAFAVQNVGAYGQEASQVVEEIEAYDREEGKLVVLTGAECHFGYRKSIFNSEAKGKYVILRTKLRLSLVAEPMLKYPDLQRRFEGVIPTIQEIREFIIETRNKKFPFPTSAVNGNSGSFLKNFTINEAEYEELRKRFEEHFPDKVQRLEELRNRFLNPNGIKVPTAFLVETCGLKGMEVGGAKINPAQPVVIINASGQAKAVDVLSLVKEVRRPIREKLGLHVYTEPEIIGFEAAELRSFDFNEEEIERYTK
jgi:UDP-N-acetylmuramate dehydrogenase